jgi:quinol monooxygenase YgiN
LVIAAGGPCERDNKDGTDPPHRIVGRLFEVYDNADAFDTHLKSDHYKKYALAAKNIVAKRGSIRSRRLP